MCGSSQHGAGRWLEMARRTTTRVGRAVVTAVAVSGMLTTAGVVAVSPAAAGTTTFTPVADTYVDSGSAGTNFGTAVELVVDNSPVRRTFVKFTVSGLTEPVTSATLRIHVRDVKGAGSSSGGSVKGMTDTSWSETAVTYNSQP